LGVITRDPEEDSMLAPSCLRAVIIRLESLDSSGFKSSLGLEATAERTSSRLVRDFEPGMLILADMGEFASGAAHARE
jgi:hypothetical protein